MTDQTAWLAEHKGGYIRSEGYIWECGDDYCGCSEAHIVDLFENRVTGKGVVIVGVWEGGFYTDHEQGAEADLAAERRRLHAEDPVREAAIQWQGGVDYDLPDPT